MILMPEWRWPWYKYDRPVTSDTGCWTLCLFFSFHQLIRKFFSGWATILSQMKSHCYNCTIWPWFAFRSACCKSQYNLIAHRGTLKNIFWSRIDRERKFGSRLTNPVYRFISLVDCKWFFQESSLAKKVFPPIASFRTSTVWLTVTISKLSLFRGISK